MYKLISGKYFKESLFECANYIECELGNPVAASNLLERAYKVSMSLKSMPARFPLSNISRLHEKGIRVAQVKRYSMFYRIDETAKTVHLLYFGYGARDWQNIL